MKKYVFSILAGLFCLAIAAGPAGAFRFAGRSNQSGLFRDIQVCTDGLKFDTGVQDVGTGNLFNNYPEGSIPDSPLAERLYITSDPTPLIDVPSVSLIPTAFTVLLGRYDVAPIANNDPYLLAANLTTPTQRLYWLSTYSLPWDMMSGASTLAVGTELYVYSEEGGPPPDGEHPSIEMITVSDCMLFPCEAEGAILGTENSETLLGTPDDDIICAFGGNDIVDGMGGDDLIFGGEGRDKLLGGDGDDKLFGNRGPDVLKGGEGNDRMQGNAGNDVMFGGSGIDRMNGNGGNDLVVGNRGNDRLNGNGGDDRLVGGYGTDVLNGGSGTNVLIQ